MHEVPFMQFKHIWNAGIHRKQFNFTRKTQETGKNHYSKGGLKQNIERTYPINALVKIHMNAFSLAPSTFFYTKTIRCPTNINQRT
jgi:hypothetical protein